MFLGLQKAPITYTVHRISILLSVVFGLIKYLRNNYFRFRHAHVQVVLPEGCTDIKVNVPYETAQTWTRRFTFLDTNFNGGRPVLTIRSKNVVEEHEKQIVISYSFSRPRMLVEPGLLVATYFCFFLFCSFIVRVRSDKKDKKKNEKSVEKVSTTKKTE